MQPSNVRKGYFHSVNGYLPFSKQDKTNALNYQTCTNPVVLHDSGVFAIDNMIKLIFITILLHFNLTTIEMV